jgi:cell shape-determining protein MreC
MNEISIDELLNQLELMKQVLEYYADTTNYHPKRPNVMQDGGHNARSALERFKNTSEEITDGFIDELKKTIDQYENIESNEEKLKKINEIIHKTKNK